MCSLLCAAACGGGAVLFSFTDVVCSAGDVSVYKYEVRFCCCVLLLFCCCFAAAMASAASAAAASASAAAAASYCSWWWWWWWWWCGLSGCVFCCFCDFVRVFVSVCLPVFLLFRCIVFAVVC